LTNAVIGSSLSALSAMSWPMTSAATRWVISTLIRMVRDRRSLSEIV
jgi:hypothetical protein